MSGPAPLPTPPQFAPYPALEPWNSGWLPVGDGHALYFEQCGAPDGLPLLVLHGGPGSGCSPRMRQLFDPERIRIVLFDQRGCGRSTPRGECTHNTTADLVADIERLRAHLAIPSWLIVGGSWGAALAIAYAATHPAACLGAVLRGAFLTGVADLDWFFGGASAIEPETWRQLADIVPDEARQEIGRWLIDAALGDDRTRATTAVRHWMAWEQALETGQPCPLPDFGAVELSVALDKYRVQAHYLRHACFLGEDALLAAASSLAGLPTLILHGESDQVCRPCNAFRLHAALPGSELRVVPGAGHNPYHPAMLQSLSAALATFATSGRFAT